MVVVVLLQHFLGLGQVADAARRQEPGAVQCLPAHLVARPDVVVVVHHVGPVRTALLGTHLEPFAVCHFGPLERVAAERSRAALGVQDVLEIGYGFLFRNHTFIFKKSVNLAF